MSEIESFFKDAVAGGYEDAWKVIVQLNLDDDSAYLHKLLLNHEAWMAVGKTRKWSDPQMVKTVYEDQGVDIQATGFFCQQILFFAYLADGLSIEESLKQLN